MQIGNRLKEIQGEMSVREFARALDVGPSTIHAYLQGRAPSIELVVSVCERFDIAPWWLLTGEGVKSRKKLAQIEGIVDALEKDAQLLDLVQRLVGMDEVELRALRGLADYQSAVRMRYEAIDGVARCMDLILDKLGMVESHNKNGIE